jgi:hypothetical protein
MLYPECERIFTNFTSKITMSYTDRYIVETYAGLFEGLSSLSKIELIESLSKSLKLDKTKKDKKFYKSFVAFSSEKSAEEIITDIKMSRKFRSKEIKL